jgi:hypothetical protein
VTISGVPKKRGAPSPDLRTVARTTIPRRPLAESIASAASAPRSMRLWLADRWPWTPGTESAIAARRPRWAVLALELSAVEPLAALDPEVAVRELNRVHDPWPEESRRIVPSPDAVSEPSSPRRRT